MKIIPVKLRHKRASLKCLVDDEDYEMLKDYKWNESTGTGGKGYARTAFTNRTLFPNKRQVHVSMHNTIMWCPKGLVIDHINGNILDNRRSNLRIATYSQNRCNSKKDSANTSGFHGVYWSRHIGKWRAQIGVNRKVFSLGASRNIRNCVVAYRLFAKLLHGKYSKY